MSKWSLKDGTWVVADSYTQQNQPTIHGITQGQPPAGFVHETKKDLRRYDKPCDSEIKSAMKEDEEFYKNKLNVDGIIRDSKVGLESGQIKIDKEVINEKNKQIKNFGSITDERGITHILPRYKLPQLDQVNQVINPVVLNNQIKEESEVNFTKNGEKVSIKIGRPEPGNLPERTNIRKLEQLAIDAAQRGDNKNRTFG